METLVAPDGLDVRAPEGLHVRLARTDDADAVLSVYAACHDADPAYPAGLGRRGRGALRPWFSRKNLAACVVVERDGHGVVGVAGLSASPPPAHAPADRRLHWMEACRLAVHPDHRGGDVSRVLVAGRLRLAHDLGADRLWLRCVPGSAAHGLYVRVGWRFLSRGWIDVPGEDPVPAVLLSRPVSHAR